MKHAPGSTGYFDVVPRQLRLRSLAVVVAVLAFVMMLFRQIPGNPWAVAFVPALMLAVALVAALPWRLGNVRIGVLLTGFVFTAGYVLIGGTIGGWLDELVRSWGSGLPGLVGYLALLGACLALIVNIVVEVAFSLAEYVEILLDKPSHFLPADAETAKPEERGAVEPSGEPGTGPYKS